MSRSAEVREDHEDGLILATLSFRAVNQFTQDVFDADERRMREDLVGFLIEPAFGATPRVV
jgi:hypothetical protein